MISFDLKCGLGHVFEAWFRSSAAYEEQRTGGLVACPVCGNADVAKAVMAPAVAAKGNQRPAPAPDRADDRPVGMTAGDDPAARLKAMLGALAKAQAQVLEQSQWVGDRFAEQARAMHYGEAEQAAIHGTATPNEARAMVEEGLAVAPLIVPITPPDRTH